MILRSCQWTPLGPYTVRVPPATAGGQSTFVADPPRGLLADGNQVFASARSGVWRRTDHPLGPWERATEHPASFVEQLAVVDGRAVFSATRRGVVEIITDNAPATLPAGAVVEGGMWAGDPGTEVLAQTSTHGVLISRDGGFSFDPLWSTTTVESVAWTGGDTYVASSFGTVMQAIGTTINNAPAPNLPISVSVGRRLKVTVLSAPGLRSVVWAVFAFEDPTFFGLFAIFRSDDGGTAWTEIVPARSLTTTATAPIFLENNDIASTFGLLLPAAVDPTDPDRLLVGLERVWEVRPTGTPTVVSSQRVVPRVLAVTEDRLWAATEDKVLSIGRVPASTTVPWDDRDRGRGAPEPMRRGVAHDGVAPLVAAAFRAGVGWSRAHPVWVSADPLATDIAIRELARQYLVARGGVQVSDGFVGPLRPLHVDLVPRIARAPGDSRIAWFGGQQLFRLEGDVVHPVVEFDAQNPASEFLADLVVSPTDPNRVFVLLSASIVQVDFTPGGSTASPIPLPSIAGFLRSIAAGVTDNRVVYVSVGHPRFLPLVAEPRILRWEPNFQVWEDLTAPSGDPGQTTSLGAIAVVSQPGGPDRVIVGGDGVWETADLGATWVSIGHGLPDVAVNALTVHEAGRRIRAFTDGRGLWERGLDTPPCESTPHEVELVLRSHDLDDGGRTSPVVDPHDPGLSLTFEDADGMRINVRRAPKAGEKAVFQRPVDQPEWGLDTVAFRQLDDRREVTAGGKALILLEAHNRGPGIASPFCVVAWVPMANGAIPLLQETFWEDFLQDTQFSGPWIIVDERHIPLLRPAQPEIVRIVFDVPADAPSEIALVAILHSSEDPVFEGVGRNAMERDTTVLARVNRRVLLAKVRVRPGPPVRVQPAEPPEQEPEEEKEDSHLGYWIAGGVALVLIGLFVAAVATGNFGDNEVSS